MIDALILALLLQVEPFQIDSKKITPEIRKEIAQLDAVRLDAFQKACAAVGAKLPEKHQVVLKAVDGADPDPAKFSRHNGFAAETTSISDGVVEIRFYVEYFVNGLLYPEETLRHEMVHAVMRLDLGKARYQQLPKWLREGIAVRVANQIESKLTYSLMQSQYAGDPDKLVDGLEDANHTLDDYVEDGVALVFLGPDAPAKLEARLREGEEHRRVIEALAGKSFADFLADARDAALKEVRGAAEKMKDELDLYREILAKGNAAAAECERFLKSFPKSPLRSVVLYCRAKSSGDDAFGAYDAFIESARGERGYPGYIDDAMLRKARLYLKKKRAADATAVYSDLVKWHIGSANAVTALYEWGISIHASARDRAAALLRRALEVDPKHALAERARKLVGD